MITEVKKFKREDYDSNKHLIKSGDILLCSGNALFSNLIKKFTGSKWSHVGFILDAKEIDRLIVLESVESIGVRAVALSSYLYNYNGSGKGYDGELVIARHSEMNESLIENLSRKAVDLLGHLYDKDEIIRIMAKIASSKIRQTSCEVKQNDNKFICSEYVEECFRSVGIAIKQSCGFVAPCDFANDEHVMPVMGF